MSRPRLLLTGFGPFPGAARNPTATIVDRVARRADIARRFDVVTNVFPTTWDAIAEVPDLLDEVRPEAAVLLGFARRARTVRVETRARNRVAAPHVDANGCHGPPTLAANGLERLAARWPATELVRCLSDHGLRAEASDDAGGYLCNALFHRVLETSRGRPVVFLHLPPTRDLVPTSSFGLADLEAAVRVAIATLPRALRQRSA